MLQLILQNSAIKKLFIKMKLKLNPKKYYRTIENCHGTGDIWKNLPSMGLLKQKKCSGIIVTPGCDLANAKVETITYLPLISIRSFFASRSFYYEVRSQFINLVKDKVPTISEYLLKNTLPDIDGVEVLNNIIIETYSKEKAAVVKRIVNGIEILKIICGKNETIESLDKYKDFFGDKQFKNICIDIIRNSYSNDLHFLPKDEQDIEWSSIMEHSVVLFRYPITIPIEVLDIANTNGLSDWNGIIKKVVGMYPIAQQFQDFQPVKTITLSIEFLSDLLTRFCGLYMRIGSPDFTHDTIHEIANEI